MQTVRILSLLLALGVAAPGPTWAQSGPPPAPPSQERPMRRELPPEARQLMERQRQEMRALREKHREERRALRETLRETRREQGGPGGPPEKKAL